MKPAFPKGTLITDHSLCNNISSFSRELSCIKPVVFGLRFVVSCLDCILDLMIPGFPVDFLKADGLLSFEVLLFIHLKHV